MAAMEPVGAEDVAAQVNLARYHSQSGQGRWRGSRRPGRARIIIRDLPFRYAFRRALGIDQSSAGPRCPSTSCRESPLTKLHCRLSSKYGIKGNRHTDMKDVLQEVVQGAGLRTTRKDGEPSIRFSDHGLRMDFVTHPSTQ